VFRGGGRRGLFVYSANIDCQGPVNKIKLPSRQNDIPGPREGRENPPLREQRNPKYRQESGTFTG